MNVKVTVKGDHNKTEAWLRRLKDGSIYRTLDKFGPIGVSALASATPVDTSGTANSWTYQIERGGGGYSIHWTNTNMNGGFSVAMGLQYGHGTGTGGYIQGRDYINPAIRPIFDQMLEEVMRVVKS